MADNTDETRYVVRGAKMWCECGSHHRRIHLPNSHGSYVNGQPMMNEEDCLPVQNIPYFGTCASGENPNTENLYLVGEDGMTKTGKRCCPLFYDRWMVAKTDTKVDGKAALTTKSQLICAFGGVITFKDDGQSAK